MGDYELALLVDPLTEHLEDVLLEEFDAVINQHAELVLVALRATGASAQEATQTAITALQSKGVQVRRLYKGHALASETLSDMRNN